MAKALCRPRKFRESLQVGELLALDADIDFSYLFTGPVPNDRTEDNVAIVTINGPLEHHCTYWWDSYEDIHKRVEDAFSGNDVVDAERQRMLWDNWGQLPEDYAPPPATPARAVIMKFDSPGGEAAGCTYLHRKLRSLRKQYDAPLYAYANEMAASAAYQLASAADEIWLPDTGRVGSIGVIATLFDRTEQNKKMGVNIELITSGDKKSDNHADRVITDDIRERTQGMVDDLALIFFQIVAKARGVSVDAVRSLQAGVYTGQDAVNVGIADGVARWDRFLRLVTEALPTPDEPQADSEVAASAA